MKRTLFFLLTFLSLPSPGFGQDAAVNNEAAAECAKWSKTKIPAADLPSAEDRKGLNGVFSEDLYFGFGQPADPVKARKGAYLERESGDAPVFGGAAMLMMIYANGKGTERNFDLALKFACEINDPLIANPSRIDHLLALRAEHWMGNDFSLCDEAGSSFLVGACTELDEKVREIERTRKLDKLIERWTRAEKDVFGELQKAASDFIKASSDNEVDTTGTGRASFVFAWRTWLRDGFLAALERSEQGQLPSFSAAELKKADDELNAAYSSIQSAGAGAEGMGDVTPDAIKTAERAWLKFREAWVKFGGSKYPNLSPESWRTWLTYDRIVMLHFIPGPGTPDWAAFHEYLPWRYQYELGNYREAMRLKPDWAPPHDALGQDLSSNGDWDGAIQEYREAIRLDPNYFDAHEHLAFAFEKKNDWDNAVKEHCEVVRLKPNDALWRSALGRALQSKQDWDGAIQEYRKAIRLEPGSPVYHQNLAGVLAGKKDWDGAISEYRESLRLESRGFVPASELAPLHDALGDAFAGKKDWDSAIKEYGEAVRLVPDWAPAHSDLGRAFENKQDWNSAIKEYREVVKLKPGDADAHWVLCRFLAEVKSDLDGGIEECRESIRLKPDNVSPHGELGWMLEKKKEFDAAIAEDREAIRLQPGWSLLVNNLGWALYEKGDVDAALVQYREALRLKPDDAQIHLNIGFGLDKKADWDGAIQEYREAFRLEPVPGGLHYYVGQTLEHKGDKAAALDEYRQASEADPKNADYRAAYEKLRQQLKQ